MQPFFENTEQQEIPLQDLRELVSPEELVHIDQHQIRAGERADFSNGFLPEFEDESAAERLGRLALNHAMFSDEVEDFIDNDTLVLGILRLQRNTTKGEAYRSSLVAAMRSRRSIVALLFERTKETPLEESLGEAA